MDATTKLALPPVLTTEERADEASDTRTASTCLSSGWRHVLQVDSR